MADQTYPVALFELEAHRIERAHDYYASPIPANAPADIRCHEPRHLVQDQPMFERARVYVVDREIHGN
jgi:hypothetical protein